MAPWTEPTQTERAHTDLDQPLPPQTAIASQTNIGPGVATDKAPRFLQGWPVPSTICENPDEARACIQLPEFDELLLEKARVISGRFPFAEAEYRVVRRTQPA